MDTVLKKHNEQEMWSSLSSNLKSYIKIKKELEDIEDVYNDETQEAQGNPILYGKEWDLLKEIKEYLISFDIINRINNLNNDEIIELELLINKSNTVSYDSKLKYPYKKMLFIPVVLWNDKDDQDFFEQENEVSKLYNFSETLTPYFKERLMDNMKNIGLIKIGINLGTASIFDADKALDYMEKGYNINQFQSLPQELMEDLTTINNENWLQSGLLPIQFSSEEYEHIADLNLDNDGLFNEYFKAKIDERIDFGNTLPLLDAINKVEEIKFNLWAKTILKHPLTKNAIYRESTLLVDVDDKNKPLFISAIIEDVGENEEDILFEWSGSRNLHDKIELTESLIPWINNTKPENIWNVVYQLYEEENQDEIDKVIIKKEFEDKIVIPDSITIH